MLPSFDNADLLTTALTHRSALNEKSSTSQESNERLEFLGDAVLELITTEFLYSILPTEQEGKLTAYRSALVKTATLAEVASELGLGDRLFLSKGEEATGGRQNVSLLADTMEAVLGALYLDQGYGAAKAFLSESLFPKFEAIRQHRLYKDAKSALQEYVQAKGFDAPLYTVISEVGPDHDKHFTIEVEAMDRKIADGIGKSKQQAQQSAATAALAVLGVD